MPAAHRHRIIGRLAGIAVAAILLAACGQSTTTDANDATVTAATPDIAATGTSVAAPVVEDPTDATDAGDVGDASSVAAITATTADGDTISPADFAGTPVFVETFATWCSNCRSQLGSTQDAAATAGDDAVFLALSVETNLDPGALADYASDNGFDNILFGVLADQDLATLQTEFGQAVLVPPSTPKFTVAADGSISDLTTGFESVDEILAQL